MAEYTVDVATPGFAAIAVDTGIVGLVLLFSLLVSCVIQINRQQRSADWFILFAPVAFVLHLFIMNIFDVMLLYLVLMPCGPFLVLAKSRVAKCLLTETMDGQAEGTSRDNVGSNGL